MRARQGTASKTPEGPSPEALARELLTQLVEEYPREEGPVPAFETHVPAETAEPVPMEVETLGNADRDDDAPTFRSTKRSPG